MKYIITGLILVALTGCQSLLAHSPTFEYCNEVHYDRSGNQMTITAKCSAPIGGGSLPIDPTNIIK